MLKEFLGWGAFWQGEERGAISSGGAQEICWADCWQDLIVQGEDESGRWPCEELVRAESQGDAPGLVWNRTFGAAIFEEQWSC